MSLPVFFASEAAQAVAGQRLVLGEEVAGHAVRVRRLGPGDELELVDGAGSRVRATIADASATAVSVDVTSATRSSPPTPRLVLVQALAKGDRDLQAIEQATEIGVDEVVPWSAERSIADWPEKKRHKMAAKWENLLRAASLQARRSRFPHLHELARGTRLASTLGAADLVFVLHETAELRLSQALAEPRATAVERIVLVVGPEGGVSDAELAALTAAGATPVLLGRTILRSSSAGPAGLVMAQCALDRW